MKVVRPTRTTMSAQPEQPRKPTGPRETLASEKAGALHSDDSVQTAGERMRKHDAGAWPVTEDTKLVGMVDEKNPDWEAGGHGHDPQDSKVGEIMNRHAIFCYEDDSCAHAEELMREHGLSHLAVVDKEMRVVGIFSRRKMTGLAPGAANEETMAAPAGEIVRKANDVVSDADAKAAVEPADKGSQLDKSKQDEDLPNCHA